MDNKLDHSTLLEELSIALKMQERAIAYVALHKSTAATRRFQGINRVIENLTAQLTAQHQVLRAA